MSKPTPTQSEVRCAYSVAMYDIADDKERAEAYLLDQYEAAFDRWLAEHDAKVRAEEREQDTREPSDAERMAAARAINLAGWTCYGGADEPGQFDTCEDCQSVCLVVADAALLAAQEVRRG